MIRICALLSLILLTSCKENETVNRSNEEPKALQGKSIDFGRFRSPNDLVNDLYSELVNKSPKLKALESELNEFNPQDTLNSYYGYDQKSNDYYLSARNQADLITDSIMKQKILNLIKKSEEKYVSEKTDLKVLIKTINQKRNSIYDYHNTLKIVLTLPLIEKYQKEHLPKNDPFVKMIEKENELIQKVKQNTPKY
ncbi:hypothetical protein [Flavobacterium limi]|uniref:Lipoprotein n=1 Tax=Flavobacterium limi TaxID=2045105 RepID=A0ABQ1UC74_9FLAO|nr:hypothetical protein [Flavobacterium limi]GGF15112.1 hypothetical protein GCM10011518_25600 [Flavobacterium limi]